MIYTILFTSIVSEDAPTTTLAAEAFNPFDCFYLHWAILQLKLDECFLFREASIDTRFIEDFQKPILYLHRIQSVLLFFLMPALRSDGHAHQ